MSPECKRRKIKCDRTQPCAPCTRRGEQSKCQWHIVEPVEKYVTRAEYDELKGRFEQLDALVRRLLPTTTVASTSMPYYQLAHTGAGGASGVSVEAVQTYNPSTTPGVSGPIAGYPSMMPPPPPPPQGTYPQHIETSNQAPHRYIKTDDLQSGARHQNVYHPASTSMGGPVTSPLLSTATHHTLPQHSPLLPSSPSRSHYRRSPEMLRSPSTTSATIKSSALSLSSITSPYNVNPDQSKKLPRADAHTGRASAPRISGSKRPSGSFFRDGPSATGTSAEGMYVDTGGASGIHQQQQTSAPPSSFQFHQPSSQPSRRYSDTPTMSSTMRTATPSAAAGLTSPHLVQTPDQERERSHSSAATRDR